MKKMAIFTSLVTFLEFPLVYIFFYLKYSVICCYIIHIFIYSVLLFVKLLIVKEYVGIAIVEYLKEVLLKAFLVTLGAILLPIILYNIIDESLLRLCIVIFSSVIVSLLTIYFWGISKTEREIIFLILKKYARKKQNSLD